MAGVVSTNEFRKNLKLDIDNVPFVIVDFQHVSPGKGSAFTRTRLKNMLTNNTVEKTFKSGEKFAEADLEWREMQFLYKDTEGYNFMNVKDYEQIVLQEEALGNDKNFMQENMELKIIFYNQRPIGVELPSFVDLKVLETDPVFKGNTVTGGGKPAKLSTGAIVQVPFHIVEGDMLKIDTRDGGSYVEKANK